MNSPQRLQHHVENTLDQLQQTAIMDMIVRTVVMPAYLLDVSVDGLVHHEAVVPVSVVGQRPRVQDAATFEFTLEAALHVQSPLVTPEQFTQVFSCWYVY